PFAVASVVAILGLALSLDPAEIAQTFYTIPVLGFSLGIDSAAVEHMFAGQIVSPSTIGAFAAILANGDCLDIDPNEIGDFAAAVLAKDAPDKASLYRAVIPVQAALLGYRQYSVHFPGFLSVTGLDSPDPLVRDVFGDWFNIRSTRSM